MAAWTSETKLSKLGDREVQSYFLSQIFHTIETTLTIQLSSPFPFFILITTVILVLRASLFYPKLLSGHCRDYCACLVPAVTANRQMHAEIKTMDNFIIYYRLPHQLLISRQNVLFGALKLSRYFTNL